MTDKIKCPKCGLKAFPNEWLALYGHCPGCGAGANEMQKQQNQEWAIPASWCNRGWCGANMHDIPTNGCKHIDNETGICSEGDCPIRMLIDKKRVIDALLIENERLQKQLDAVKSATWDDGHELADIWRKIIEFNDKYYPDWKKTDEVYLSNALAGECGEICNMTKHRAGGGTNKRDHDDVDLLEELADLFIYMELLIATKGYTLGIFAESIRAKIKKNAERVEQRRGGSQ